VLPLVPRYVSYVAGQSLDGHTSEAAARNTLAALRLSVFFVLGFSTVFVILGASATALGQLFLSYRYEANLAAGAVVIVFGLLMMGLVRWPWLQQDFRLHLDLPLAGRLPLMCSVSLSPSAGRRASAPYWARS
jgi:cytochrome c-type biogenesis protein